jgi:hypothetical protein
MSETQAPHVFRRCVNAVESGMLIQRESRKDKEFHFQDWFRERLAETELNFEQGGRNSYPDFRLEDGSVRHGRGDGEGHMSKTRPRLIETDRFPFEFLSALAKRESWRKEVHRPIYHVHKWWAKRLGSVFRGLALGCVLGEDEDLTGAFYQSQGFPDSVVFDPFMGSGTTIGEAHKLGFTALGRDINPVAVEAVRVALGSLQAPQLEETFAEVRVR